MSPSQEISLHSPHLIKLMNAVHEKDGMFRFQAKGFSMFPFIRDGDILTIAKSLSGYKVGEVVAFVLPSFKKLVVHRIIGERSNKCLIKGDNFFKKDGLIPLQDVLGKVVKVERCGREIFFGMGPEQRIIVYLNKWNLLRAILLLWCLIPYPVRQKIKTKKKLYGKFY